MKEDPGPACGDITVFWGESQPHLMVTIVVHVAWEWEPWGQSQLSFKHFRFNEFLQIRPAESPVPVIGDMASIHDLSEEVTQVIIGDLRDEGKRERSPHRHGAALGWAEQEPQGGDAP